MRDRLPLILTAVALLAVVVHWDWQTSARRKDVDELKNQIALLSAEVTYLRNRKGSDEDEPKEPDQGQMQDALARLGDGDILKRYRAALKVERYGDAAVPELFELVKGDDRKARESALLLLGQANVESILPELRDLVRRSLAPTKTGPPANPMSKTEIAALLGILARQEDAESTPLFRLGLESTGEPIRVAAILGARRLLQPELVPALVARLSKERRPLASQIEGVLCATCNKAPDSFRTVLRKLPPKSRYEVARSLSTNPSRNCRAMLRELGSDPDPRVSSAATRLLEKPVRASGDEGEHTKHQSEARQIADSLLKELKKEVGK